MARKKVVDLNVDKTLSFGDKPDQVKRGREVSGYLLGHKKITTDYGPATVHILQGKDGNFGIYGSKQLTDNLMQIELGVMVFVKYVDKVKIKGGKTLKKFDVEFDDEDVIEVTGIQAAASDPSDAGDEAEEEEEEEQEAEEEEAEEEEEEEEETQAASSRPLSKPNSATSSKAQALLSKGRKSASA